MNGAFMRFWIILLALHSFLASACSPQTDATGTQDKAGHSTEPRIRIRIPDTPFMGVLPMYIAEEKCLLEKNGLEVQWVDVRDPGQGTKLLIAGKADLVMTTFANIVPIEARKPGSLRFLLPASETSSDPGSYILVRPDSTIKSLADLGGTTLGTYSGPSQKAYALIVLEKLGYREPEDVRLIQVAPSAQIQGLFGGSFDALFTVEPYASIALVKGAKSIATGVRTAIISDPFWLGAAAVPAGVADAQPSLIPKLLRALDDAVRYIRSHEPESREVLARRTGTDAAVAQRSALYNWVAYPSADQLDQIQEALDLLHQEKTIDAQVDARTLFTNIDLE
jgi:ABC-type nitrate/sulfonate/bicarbonate transport system substrate-binding protein